MRATIEKEHGAELGFALTAAATVMTVVLFRTEVLASEPAPDGLAAQVDSELIGQCLGELGEVEVEAVFAVDADDSLSQATGFSVSWGAAMVAVADAIG